MRINTYILTLLIILIPAIGYSTDVIVRQRVVQFDPNTYLGIQGYYTHGQQLIQRNEVEKAEEIRILKEQLDELKKQTVALQQIVLGNGSTGNNPVQPPPIPDVPQVSPLEAKVLKIYTEKCAKCHADENDDGGLTLLKDGKLVIHEDSKEELAIRTNVFLRTDAGLLQEGETRMPKGSPPLPDEDVNTLKLWMREKAVKK